MVRDGLVASVDCTQAYSDKGYLDWGWALGLDTPYKPVPTK